MRKILYSCLSTCILALLLATSVVAQNSLAATRTQTANALANLPEADLVIYASPQRILSEAAPKVVPPAELNKWRANFFDIKRAIGIDPATVDYLVIAVRFQRPSGDLSFVAPDVMVVMGGDFSAESLLSSAQLFFQDKVQTEKFGNRTINTLKVDPIVTEAEKNPMLKPYTEVSAVSLTPNSLAIGNARYIKAAVDAADGNGRIDSAIVGSLLRDPNALIAASGSPLSSFAKSIGLLGTETSPRPSRCDTRFGDFYAAITMNATDFNLRGAMNTDNPESAKIINGLLAAVMKEAIDSVPDKTTEQMLTAEQRLAAKQMLKQIRMTAKDNEIVWEADIPQTTVADFMKEPTKSKATATDVKQKSPTRKKRRTVKKT